MPIANIAIIYERLVQGVECSMYSDSYSLLIQRYAALLRVREKNFYERLSFWNIATESEWREYIISFGDHNILSLTHTLSFQVNNLLQVAQNYQTAVSESGPAGISNNDAQTICNMLVSLFYLQ